MPQHLLERGHLTKPRLFVLLFIAGLLLVLGTIAAACGDDGEEEGITVDDLTGLWQQGSSGNVLQLNEDGTFIGARNPVALEKNEPAGIGEFRLEGTLFTFVTSDDSPNCAGQIGTYQIELTEEGDLQFVLEEDPCAPRAVGVPDRSYSRISP